jgi:precorrin-4 methylase
MLEYNSCVICNDSISDPICRSCYLRQTQILLSELNLHEVANKIILTKVKERFPVDLLNETSCVLCGRTNVTLCRYCFSVILSNVLRELNFSEDLIENFGCKVS